MRSDEQLEERPKDFAPAIPAEPLYTPEQLARFERRLRHDLKRLEEGLRAAKNKVAELAAAYEPFRFLEPGGYQLPNSTWDRTDYTYTVYCYKTARHVKRPYHSLETSKRYFEVRCALTDAERRVARIEKRIERLKYKIANAAEELQWLCWKLQLEQEEERREETPADPSGHLRGAASRKRTEAPKLDPSAARAGDGAARRHDRGDVAPTSSKDLLAPSAAGDDWRSMLARHVARSSQARAAGAS